MVFSPSLPPNHSKTTRILPDCSAAASRLARFKTKGTGPMPPRRPKPRPPAPIRIMSRRETPQSLNRLLVRIVVYRLPSTVYRCWKGSGYALRERRSRAYDTAALFDNARRKDMSLNRAIIITVVCLCAALTSAQTPAKRTPEQMQASYDAHKGDFDYLLGDWEFSAVSRDYGNFRGYWSAVRLR